MSSHIFSPDIFSSRLRSVANFFFFFAQGLHQDGAVLRGSSEQPERGRAQAPDPGEAAQPLHRAAQDAARHLGGPQEPRGQGETAEEAGAGTEQGGENVRWLSRPIISQFDSLEI